jgi:uncharacterized protein YacL
LAIFELNRLKPRLFQLAQADLTGIEHAIHKGAMAKILFNQLTLVELTIFEIPVTKLGVSRFNFMKTLIVVFG